MSWTNATKDSASWSNSSPHSSAFTNQSQTYENQVLLTESGFSILLETGYKLLLETLAATVWANQTQH